MLRKMVKGSAVALSANIGHMLTALVVTLILITFLTQADYGLFVLTIAAYRLIYSFMNYGFGTLVAVEITRFREEGDQSSLKRLVQDYMVVQFAMGVIFSLATFLLANYLSASYDSKVIDLISLSLVIIFFTAIRQVFKNTLYGYMRVGWYASVPFLESTLRLLFTFLLVVVWGYGVQGAIMAYLFAVIITVGILSVLYMKILLSLRGIKSAEKSVFWSIFKAHGKYVPVYGILRRLNDGVPEWIIQMFWGLETVAVFGFAKRLYVPAKEIFASIEIVLLPNMTKELVRSKDRFKLLLQRATKYSFWLAIVLVVFGIVLAPFAFEILNQPAYNGSVPVLQILLVGLIALSLGNALRSSFFALKAQKKLAFSFAVGVVVLIVISLPLTYYFAAEGMAVAILVGFMVTVAIQFYLLKKLDSELIISLKSLFTFDEYDRSVASRIFRKTKRVLHLG